MTIKYKWLEIFMFIPPIMFLAAINVIGDAAFVFRKNINNQIADYILQGNSVQSFSGEYNQREVKRLIIEKMDKNVDCLVIGPSLAYRIGKESVKASSFYNLGFGGASHYDLFAEFAWLKINNIKYKKLIICIDYLSLFNFEYTNTITQWEPYFDYYKYMIDYLEEKPQKDEPKIDYWAIIKSLPLFSISYFQKSYRVLIKSYKENKNLNLIKLVNIPNSETPYFYTSDGSVGLTFESENRSIVKYKLDAKKYLLSTSDKQGKTFGERFKGNINEEFKNNFLLLINYLKRNNIEIIFWYHPFAPIVWDKIDHKQYPGIYDLDIWTRKLAIEKSIKTVGSYNPHECGVTDDCFIDARHLKRSAIDKYFHF